MEPTYGNKGSSIVVKTKMNSIDNKKSGGLTPVIWTAVSLDQWLGNQLFQFASAYGIARSRGSRLCVNSLAGSQFSDSVELTDTISECPSADFRPAYEAGFAKYDPTLATERGNITVGSYLQSYKYFDEVPFQLKPRAWAKRWVEEHGVSIGIHVRRGDYKEAGTGGRLPPALYFEYCLRQLRQRHGPLRVVVVSDDIEWVQAQPVFADAILHTGGSAAEEMAVLAACPHVISSVGALGWWAMRLKTRHGESFYYADPWDYEIVPHIEKRFRAEDYFLPEWTGVGDVELASLQPAAAAAGIAKRVA